MSTWLAVGAGLVFGLLVVAGLIALAAWPLAKRDRSRLPPPSGEAHDWRQPGTDPSD